MANEEAQEPPRTRTMNNLRTPKTDGSWHHQINAKWAIKVPWKTN